MTPSAMTKSADFVALVEALKDSITATKFVQVLPFAQALERFSTHDPHTTKHIRPIAALIHQLRDLELVQKVADSAPLPAANLTLGGVSDSVVPNAWDNNVLYAQGNRIVYEDEVVQMFRCSSLASPTRHSATLVPRS